MIYTRSTSRGRGYDPRTLSGESDHDGTRNRREARARTALHTYAGPTLRFLHRGPGRTCGDPDETDATHPLHTKMAGTGGSRRSCGPEDVSFIAADLPRTLDLIARIFPAILPGLRHRAHRVRAGRPATPHGFASNRATQVQDRGSGIAGTGSSHRYVSSDIGFSSRDSYGGGISRVGPSC